MVRYISVVRGARLCQDLAHGEEALTSKTTHQNRESFLVPLLHRSPPIIRVRHDRRY
jgi:hypothetical protein